MNEGFPLNREGVGGELRDGLVEGCGVSSVVHVVLRLSSRGYENMGRQRSNERETVQKKEGEVEETDAEHVEVPSSHSDLDEVDRFAT